MSAKCDCLSLGLCGQTFLWNVDDKVGQPCGVGSWKHVVVHGAESLSDVSALQGGNDVGVLLIRGFDVSKCAKGVFAVVTGDGANSHHLLPQVGVSSGLVDDFMKCEIGLLPIDHVFRMHNAGTLVMQRFEAGEF